MCTAGLLLFLAVTGIAAAAPRAHSHNDYEQPRPLLDALAQHFDVIEADVRLAGGRLLVAHESTQVRSDRTLESLYLDPLRVWLKQKEHYPVILLIDVKTDADPTWRALDAMLAQYPSLAGPVTFIISGNQACGLMSVQPYCRAALDGSMEDLDSGASADLIPLISDNQAKFFARRGDGPFPEVEQARLTDLVARAHAQGRLLRFWNTPETPACWLVLRAVGVDVTGTDHLTALRKFLGPR